MKFKFITIISFCIIMISCKEETKPLEEIEPEIIANGMVDGTSWKAYLGYKSVTDGYLEFSLYQKKDEVGCPHHHISFSNIPFSTGTFSLKTSRSTVPEDGIVFNVVYYTCGDAHYANYNVDEDSFNVINITTVDEKMIKGNFTTTYIISDTSNTLDIPSIFEFSNVVFEIEL